MAVTKEEILESVGDMSCLSCPNSSKTWRKKFGVSAQGHAVAVAAPAAGGDGAEAAEEQTEFDVVHWHERR